MMHRLAGFRAMDFSRLLGPALGMALVLAVAYSLLWTIGKSEDFQDFDYGAYYRAGQAVAAGRSPFFVEEHGVAATFVYAPAYAFLFQPVARLDYLWGSRLWMVINWGLTMVCIWLALELVVGPGWRGQMPWALLWLTLIPMGNFFWANIRTGQVGILMMTCCLGWAVCGRRGKPFLGGILLAAGCALKIFPALLLPYLVVRRDFRGLAGVLTGSLILFAVPAAWVGWSGTVRLHLDWPRHCLATQVASETFQSKNQSFLGLLARMPWISNGGACFSLENLHDLERNYSLVVLALTTLCYAGISWSLRKSRGRLTPEEERFRDNVHLALLLIFVTMAHVRAWGCNFVTMLPGCMLLAQQVLARRPGWQFALGALALGVMTGPLSWHTPADGSWSGWAWVLQAKFFWYGLAVAIACWWCGGFIQKEVSPVHQQYRPITPGFPDWWR